MRYRVESPSLWVTSDEVEVKFRIPDPIYDLLETESGSPNLKAASRKKVLEAIRLVANETRGGHVLCATGQKVYGPSPSEIFYKAERTRVNGIPYVQLFILKSALISAANGDPDDLAAISAATTGDMVTVELDWGDTPFGGVEECSEADVQHMFDGMLYDDEGGMWVPSGEVDENGGLALNAEVTEDGGVIFVDD